MARLVADVAAAMLRAPVGLPDIYYAPLLCRLLAVTTEHTLVGYAIR